MPWRSIESLHNDSAHETRDSSMEHQRTSVSSRRSSIASVFRRRSSVSSVASSVKGWWKPVSTMPQDKDSHLPTHLPPPHAAGDGTITFNTNSFGTTSTPPVSGKRYHHVPSHAAADHVKQTRTPSMSHATRAPSLSEATRRSSLAPPSALGMSAMGGGRSGSVCVGGRMHAARAPSIAVVSEDGS